MRNIPDAKMQFIKFLLIIFWQAQCSYSNKPLPKSHHNLKFEIREHRKTIKIRFGNISKTHTLASHKYGEEKSSKNLLEFCMHFMQYVWWWVEHSISFYKCCRWLFEWMDGIQMWQVPALHFKINQYVWMCAVAACHTKQHLASHFRWCYWVVVRAKWKKRL